MAAVLHKHQSVFAEGLGTYSGPEVHINMDPRQPPQFCKARAVPYALREAVERELGRLESEGVIEPVPHSEWASPVVTVVKEDGSLRLCGDYK